MRPVKPFQLFVSKLRDNGRVTATIIVICRFRVESFLNSLIKYRNRRTGSAFHLVIDHSFLNQRRIGVVRLFKFQPVAFLRKIEGVKVTEENCVKINLQKIEVILLVLTSERIRCKVARCKSIHKSIQRSSKHGKERVSNWVFLAPT